MQKGSASRIIAGAVAVAAAIALACSDSSGRTAPSPASSAASPTPPVPTEPDETTNALNAANAPGTLEMSAEELAARGRNVFMANCIACHNQNPSQAGAVGPAIAGSSLELVVSKVMRNEYPPGYTPKRDSRAMIPLAFLEKELPAIHAFLAAVK